ncbi:DoxX family protein [Pseudomonas sp. MM211]|uniref:DoxX family protein n=1 Tax=Pseudomonas sp. MM211 TaxID=2866808 RepID=UPI001CEC5C64|nr:DoxX family protein [Pseudomonas sp. MM211]UCJ14854.1 DoxX family protein [Pseudomonas sp. MM211]
MHPTLVHKRSDWALLFLRVAGSLLLLAVHGLPKLLNIQTELDLIEDPLGLGPVVTLSLALFAEVVCPLLIILGPFTRLASLPILAVLLVSLVLVHPEWSLAEGQFAWLLAIIFTTLAISGPGRFALGRQLPFQ